MKKMQGKAKKWIAIAAAISILGSQIFDGLFLKQTYAAGFYMNGRSEEHTSELQSPS